MNLWTTQVLICRIKQSNKKSQAQKAFNHKNTTNKECTATLSSNMAELLIRTSTEQLRG